MRHSRSVFQALPKLHQIKPSLRPAAGAISCKTWRFLNPHSQIHWHFHQIDPDRPEKHFHFSHFLMSESHPAQWTGSWKKGDENTYHTPFIDSSLCMSKGLCRKLQMSLEGPSKKFFRFYFRKSNPTHMPRYTDVHIESHCKQRFSPESKVCGIPRLYLKCFGYVPHRCMKSAPTFRQGTSGENQFEGHHPFWTGFFLDCLAHSRAWSFSCKYAWSVAKLAKHTWIHATPLLAALLKATTIFLQHISYIIYHQLYINMHIHLLTQQRRKWFRLSFLGVAKECI